ncbi:mechanosensitive ion channel protein MscS [Devosia nitrariae]|uniref:Mechanosensitive ion channel protein MscS n=2 Tax=Devosia nitrariae TaxID=2071872 RepID=A0ABQ5W847_9HYPH|nr:mechanosensitive ion channel protein MscS [Devosia nitrariae]
MAGSPGALAQDPFGLTGGTAQETSAPAATPLETLIEVLKDDAARQALIEELETRAAGAAGTDTAAGEQAGASDISGEAATIGGEIAQFTQQASESAAETVDEVWRQVRRIPAIFSAFGAADYRAIGWIVLDLLAVVVITYGTYFAIRFLTERFRRLADLRAVAAGRGAVLLAAFVILISNLAIVLAAWAAGYVVTLSLVGNAGEVAFHHSLFLNAFLIVEVVQAGARAVLAPRRPDLRLLRVPDEDAWMLTGWLRWATSIFAFGQFLLVPVFARFVSFTAAQALSVLIYVAVLAMAINLVLRLRQTVADWLTGLTSKDPGGVLHFSARYWHVPVLIYLIVLFAVVIVWPQGVLVSMLSATLKIILAMVLGAIAAGILARVIMTGVRLPPNINTRIPLLERRLNAFVPRALTVLRILVFMLVVAITLDTIGLFSISGWLSSEFGTRLAASLLTLAFIFSVAFFAWLALTSWVDYRLLPANGAVKSRERTLLVLARNAATIAIIVFTLMFTLSEIGLDIAPLLASAGIIGLAVGFGAQKAVQDIITGIFIQLEGAIDVGDVVTIGGISGSVERLTIRSAGLRDVNGIYHIVPFSSVDTVSNFMRGFAFALADIGVAYRENLDEVKQAMLDAYEELKKNETVADDLVEPELEWMGIDKFADSAMIVRARIKTLPGRQWAVNRAYNAEIKTIFDARGIEIPFPHQTVYFGEDKSGNAPPMHMVSVIKRSHTADDERRAPASPPKAETVEPEIAAPPRPAEPSPPEVPDADDFTPPDDR